MPNLESKICEIKNFWQKFLSDLKNRENWKLKIVYYFLLTGIVILWAQLTVHQNSLNLTSRDTADFVSVSSVIGIVMPFSAGAIADKIGNFIILAAGSMVLMGLNAFVFLLLPEVQMVPGYCNTTTNISKFRHTSPDMGGDDIIPNIGQSLNCSDIILSNTSLLIENLNISAVYNCSDVMDKARYDVSNSLEKPCDVTVRNEKSYRTAYWAYLTTRTLFMILLSISFTLFDGAAIVLDKENGVDYGLQRAWGTFAALTASYLGGVLIDVYSQGKPKKDFTLMFLASGLCSIIAGVVAFTINLKLKLPATHLSSQIIKNISQFQLIVLLFIVLFKGFLMGYAETFMYLFMNELGASATLIGLTVTVGASCEILLQVLATPLMNILGKTTVIFIGILFIAIRFIGFSYAYDPRVIVGLEALDAWSSGFCMTAMFTQSSSLASADVITSLRGIIGALHDGVGKLLSAVVGIEIKEYFGERLAWKFMASVALLSSLVYAILSFTYYMGMKLKKKKTYPVAGKNGKPVDGHLNTGFDEDL